jgi:hypothetical protein
MMLAVLRRTLALLRRAIKGLIVMTLELEQMYNAMLINKVPPGWTANSYPSLKPLASWVSNMIARLEFMHSVRVLAPPPPPAASRITRRAHKYFRVNERLITQRTCHVSRSGTRTACRTASRCPTSTSPSASSPVRQRKAPYYIVSRAALHTARRVIREDKCIRQG